ncbi:MAG TPA: ferritin-like domain-containing protein, partial [Sphingobium sp.]|nr:ferritin-like domain-containing protein [Sphingobium sp.]
MSLPAGIDSVGAACAHVLATPEPLPKLMAARAVARGWAKGRLAHRFDVAMPDRPARPEAPLLLPPNQMPKRGRIGSERARIAMLHALAHIEFVAIDLAFDLIGRFGGEFPAAFTDDWMRVGAEEAMHFALLDRRLRQMGSHYGALPAHDGLWQAATETAHDAMARLAIVPMVLEARALDITPATIARFEGAGDSISARMLRRIMTDEIRHVAAGTTWFGHATNRAGLEPANHYQILVKRHFRG